MRTDTSFLPSKTNNKNRKQNTSFACVNKTRLENTFFKRSAYKIKIMLATTGYKIGNGLLLASGITFGSFFFSSRARQNAGPVALLGTSFALVAIYFKTAYYMDDPEFRAQFLREIENSLFSSAVKKHGLPRLLQLTDHRNLRTYFERELGTEGPISTAIEKYGTSTLLDLMRNGIVSVDDLRARFDEQVRRSQNFTTLWHALGGGSHLSDMQKVGIVNREATHALFFEEFNYVDINGNPRNSGGAPQQQRDWIAGTPLGLIRALTQYGSYAKQSFGVTERFFMGVIEHSDYCSRIASLPELLEEGLLGLHKQGFVSKQLVERKFVEYCYGRQQQQQQQHGGAAAAAAAAADRHLGVDNRTTTAAADNRYDNSNNKSATGTTTAVTLWRAAKEVRLLELLKLRLLSNESVAPLFEAAIPVTYSRNENDEMTKENHIVLFCQHWEPVLRENPALIPSHLRAPMMSAWRAAERLKEERQRRVNAAEREFAKFSGRALESELASIDLHHPKSQAKFSNTNRRKEVLDRAARAKEEYDRQVAAADRDYRKEMRELHRDFCFSSLDEEMRRRNQQQGCPQQ